MSLFPNYKSFPDVNFEFYCDFLNFCVLQKNFSVFQVGWGIFCQDGEHQQDYVACVWISKQQLGSEAVICTSDLGNHIPRSTVGHKFQPRILYSQQEEELGNQIILSCCNSRWVVNCCSHSCEIDKFYSLSVCDVHYCFENSIITSQKCIIKIGKYSGSKFYSEISFVF